MLSISFFHDTGHGAFCHELQSPAPRATILAVPVASITLSVLFIVEGVPKQFFQSGIVGFKALPRCIDHLVAGNTRPIESITVALSELPNKLTLRSSIAFPKRMDGVNLSEVVGSAIYQASPVSAAKVSLLFEIVESLVERRHDVLCKAKEVPAFRDINRAELSSPLENVLEDMAMDGLKMARIEFT